MAKRVVRVGFIVYTDKDGRPVTGYLGDDVSVHKDDVERFDRFNTTGTAEPAPVVEEPAEPSTPAEPANPATPDPAGAAVPEPYEGVNVKDLKALIGTRNEGREDADKVSPAEPGNRAELVAALVADDEKNKQD